MHFSAEAGHVGVVEALLDGGAKMTRSAHGVTPLLAAAERWKRGGERGRKACAGR